MVIRLTHQQNNWPRQPSASAPSSVHAGNRRAFFWNLSRTEWLPWGNQAAQRQLRSQGLQPKLFLNRPGDRYEQDADHLAEQVMRRSRLSLPCQAVAEENAESPQTESIMGVKGELKSEGEEPLQTEPFIQRPANDRLKTPPDTQPFLHDVIHSPSRPLDATTLMFMEPRFNHDFSHVRIHTDNKAAELAHAVRTQAFALGRDIVFGPGRYAPYTFSGRLLLAHELSHVIQAEQNSGDPSRIPLRRQTDMYFESKYGLDSALTNNTILADSAVSGHAYPAVCSGGCDVEFKFSKAFKGNFNYRRGPNDTIPLRGVYVKIEAKIGGTSCNRCAKLQLIQTVRNVAKGKTDVVTASPGDPIREVRSGLNKPNAASRGWRIDMPTSSTNPFYTSLEASVIGSPTKAAVLWDAPGDLNTTIDAGKEFQTCAVCEESSGTKTVLACIHWGYLIDGSGNVNFRPTTPTSSCGATQELQDSAARWQSISGNEPSNITF
jgi:hypothetical protein